MFHGILYQYSSILFYIFYFDDFPIIKKYLCVLWVLRLLFISLGLCNDYCKKHILQPRIVILSSLAFCKIFIVIFIIMVAFYFKITRRVKCALNIQISTSSSIFYFLNFLFLFQTYLIFIFFIFQTFLIFVLLCFSCKTQRILFNRKFVI